MTYHPHYVLHVTWKSSQRLPGNCAGREQLLGDTASVSLGRRPGPLRVAVRRFLPAEAALQKRPLLKRSRWHEKAREGTLHRWHPLRLERCSPKATRRAPARRACATFPNWQGKPFLRPSSVPTAKAEAQPRGGARAMLAGACSAPARRAARAGPARGTTSPARQPGALRACTRRRRSFGRLLAYVGTRAGRGRVAGARARGGARWVEPAAAAAPTPPRCG